MNYLRIEYQSPKVAHEAAEPKQIFMRLFFSDQNGCGIKRAAIKSFLT